ncbi:metallophosphoesterase family protein [Antarctobacter jejuensis]|uniref:metallophosphoesterase family protein n=1 Tax=Antarctobacter jejuensis TaxID=1439938 RepID=UPI003FD4AAAB
MTDTIYAVGDIHGQKSMLDDILDRIARDGGGRVIFLGDYVDRGPDSKAVIETFVQGQAEGRDWIFVKGNHDRMFERFLDSAETADAQIKSGKGWFHPRLGGDTTMGSYMDLPAYLDAKGGGQAALDPYGVDPVADAFMCELMAEAREAVPETHRAFLKGLKLHHQEPGRLFVHAGIRPGLPIGFQEEEDLLWIRDEFLHDTRDHGALVVHGHTPVPTPDLRLNRLNLDTGAGYGDPLSVALFEGPEISVLTGSGRVRLN